MSSLKLKDNIKVEYDKENFVYHFYGLDTDKMKKVTSRAFSCLLGQNKWESTGKTILERFNGVIKEDIDPYYLVRGDIAEIIVKEFLENKYKTINVNVDLRTWDKEKVRYDNFGDNPKFGGLIDIAIAKPDKYRAVVEVKSKSVKDVEKIKESRGNIDEVLQGKFLSLLSGVPKCLMVYVFFDPNQEANIKEYIGTQKNIGYDVDSMIFAKEIIKNFKLKHTDFKILVFKYGIEEEKEDLKSQMEIAYKNLIHFKKNQSIAETYFTAQENFYLKDLAGHELTKEELESDLPF